MQACCKNAISSYEFVNNMSLNAITENTSRLGARIQESILEHTRDLALSRSAAVSYFDAPEEKVRNIRKQLDTSSDREKLDALKTLIAASALVAVATNLNPTDVTHRSTIFLFYCSSFRRAGTSLNTSPLSSRMLLRRTLRFASWCISTCCAMRKWSPTSHC